MQLHLKLTSLQYLKDINYCRYKWLWHKLLRFLSKIAISNVAKCELLAWIAIVDVAKPAKICQKAIIYFTKCKSVKVLFNIDTAKRWFFFPFCFLLDKHCITVVSMVSTRAAITELIMYCITCQVTCCSEAFLNHMLFHLSFLSRPSVLSTCVLRQSWWLKLMSKEKLERDNMS